MSTQPQNPQFNYDSCFAIGKNLGMTQCGLFLNWTTLETAPGTFNFALLDIANMYYPATEISIDLNLNPINTNHLEVPSDLSSAGTGFSSPVFINRYKTLLDSVKKHVPQVSLSSLVVGSEVDVYLGNNTTLWTQYQAFYSAVSTYARTLWPGLHVAAELTFNGLINQNSLAQQLNSYSDYIGVSYYPLNSDFTVRPISTIPSDFSTIANLYPSTPICFYQYGYPSSSQCNSSEVQQAQFINQTFQTWDTYSSHIHMIDFTWLHDLDTAAVDQYAIYYGLADKAFLEYLRTLGLRTWDGNGADKPAINELRCQANQRGYNTLNVTCPSAVANAKLSKPISAIALKRLSRNELSLEMPFGMYNADIRVLNSKGQTMYKVSGVKKRNIIIESSSLENGLFLVTIQDGNKQITCKGIMVR